MKLYHIYEEGGENTKHKGCFTRHPGFLAESAKDAILAFDPPGEIKTNDVDDWAWSCFDDHADKQGLEHMLCAEPANDAE